MSRTLGVELPKSIMEKLASSDDLRESQAIFLLTVDEIGSPHVALLSPYQVFAGEPSKLLIAVHSTSHSCSYIKSSGKITLIIQSLPSVLYVHCRAVEIKGKEIRNGPFSDSVFKADITMVLEDYSEKAPFISDLRFRDDEIRDDYRGELSELRKFSRD